MNSDSAETDTGRPGPPSPARLRPLRRIGTSLPQTDPRLRRLGDVLPQITGPKNERENTVEEKRAEFDRRLKAEEEAAVALHQQRLWLRSGAPLLHAKFAAGDTNRRNDAWRNCRQILGQALGGGSMVALLGDRGVGKTQLAVDLIRQECAAGRSARYITAVPLFLALRAEAGEVLAVLAEYTAPSLLVIDELGVRLHSRFEDDMLTTLLDQRYGGLVDTLLLSNEKEDAFVEAVGRSVKERLGERGKHLFPRGIVVCTKDNGWENMRT